MQSSLSNANKPYKIKIIVLILFMTFILGKGSM